MLDVRTLFVVMIARYGTYKWFIKANPTSDALVTWERRFIAGSKVFEVNASAFVGEDGLSPQRLAAITSSSLGLAESFARESLRSRSLYGVVVAEQPLGKSLRVAVEHHGIGGQFLAAGQAHAAHAPARGQDAFAGAGVADAGAAPLRERGEGLCDGMHRFRLPVPVEEFTVSLFWHPRLDADPAHRWLRSLVLVACKGAKRK